MLYNNSQRVRRDWDWRGSVFPWRCHLVRGDGQQVQYSAVPHFLTSLNISQGQDCPGGWSGRNLPTRSFPGDVGLGALGGGRYQVAGGLHGLLSGWVIPELQSSWLTSTSQEAAFSKRITEEAGVEVIGGADKYMAVCRRCYFAPNQVLLWNIKPGVIVNKSC